RYAHESLLRNEEIKTISDWVDAGSPMGDVNKAPADPKAKTETSIISPDLRLKMPNYAVNTSAKDEYRCFVLPTGLSAEKFLTEIEIVPGNFSVVHHVLVFHDTSNIPASLDLADPNPGYLGFGGTGSSSSKLIGVWVPGQDPFKMPPGMGIKLEKGGSIILQIHYPPYINNITDSSKVYFKFAPTTLREVAIASPISHTAPSLQNGPLYIPANQEKTFISKYTLPANVSIFAVAPHMHLLGSSIKSFAVGTANDTVPIVDIPKWNFHWQRTYIFPKIMKAPKNMVLWGTASYNNTAANKNNPNNPPQAVSLGEGTGDEMLLIYYWYAIYQNGDENIVIDGSTPKNVGTTVLKSTSFKVYPNPANTVIHVENWSGKPENMHCELYNLSGQLIKIPVFEILPNGAMQLDLSNVAVGTYLLKLNDGSNTQVKTIIRN
ncbi:MAG: T9SS type A sorting domain-containing protein, partial [Bacteroidia bacterium]|nr:T9SS type A sorting domain-containing protein [Bacteroidia bacterium]